MLPKAAQPGARKTLQDIYNADDRDHALKAITAFGNTYGTKWPRAVKKITDDVEELLAFYDFPAEHWIHLRTTIPIWVFRSRSRSGRCFPGRCSRRPALTLNAIDAVRLSSIRSVGLAA
nr:transposase [Pseudonocardia sp. HH130630-07]